MRFSFPILAARFTASFTATVIAASALASAHAEAAVQLSLKAQSMINGPRVTLGDVAALAGDTADGTAEIQALTAIDLGVAPLPGYTDRFTRKEIERLVRARGLNQTITWHGADAVQIERIAKACDTAQIADSAGAYLRQLLQGGGDRVELQLSEPLPDLQVPNGKFELKVRPMPFAQALHRRVTVWVDVMIDGVFFRSVTVPFRVQAYRPVLAAKRDLPQGTVPQCDALVVREEDVAGLDSAPLPADCNLVQGHLKRALTLGAPLLKAYMQAPIAVAQGDSVLLQMVDGALKLESRATALVDGEVGQRINVKPSAGTETLMAEVIAPGMVQITGK